MNNSHCAGPTPLPEFTWKKKNNNKKKEERLYVLSSGIMFWPIRLITDAFWRAALRQTDSGCMNIHPSSTAPDPSSGAFMF